MTSNGNHLLLIFIWFQFCMGRQLKHILMWTTSEFIGFDEIHFIKRNCPVPYCFITDTRPFRSDFKEFDAIAYDATGLYSIKDLIMPENRSPNQTYIFVSLESPHRYPVCQEEFNTFFNLTFTYRLDSDLVYPYFVIKDRKGEVIGPNIIMHWKKSKDMLPVNEKIKTKLAKKKKVAAWLVSHCETNSKRETIVENLQRELAHYGLNIDVYGKCGEYKCYNCWNIFQKDYYFYLSFENSLSADYVTEKLLNPLQHYIVPIVYGAANYTRFLPDGAYLNAMELKEKKLAKEMYDIINNRKRYYTFFKWHNHYTYENPHKTFNTDPYCQLCAYLNKNLDAHKVHNDFLKWWNSDGQCDSTEKEINLLEFND